MRSITLILALIVAVVAGEIAFRNLYVKPRVVEEMIALFKLEDRVKELEETRHFEAAYVPDVLLFEDCPLCVDKNAIARIGTIYTKIGDQYAESFGLSTGGYYALRPGATCSLDSCINIRGTMAKYEAVDEEFVVGFRRSEKRTEDCAKDFAAIYTVAFCHSESTRSGVVRSVSYGVKIEFAKFDLLNRMLGEGETESAGGATIYWYKATCVTATLSDEHVPDCKRLY